MRDDAPRPSLLGRIAVADGPEHPCAARFDDLDAVVIRSVAEARTDQSAVCYLDELGALRGRIGATSAVGFVLHPVLGEQRRARIVARLAWHAERAGWTAEQRATPRIVLEHSEVTVRLPDGGVVSGRILDVSKTGAKIRLAHPIAAALGSRLTVGKRYATAVRIEDATIAVRFQLPFSDETFNGSIRL